MGNRKVWFITGTSKGFGLALVKLLLKKGDSVAATTRIIKDLKNAIVGYSDNLLPLEVDLTSDQAVKLAIKQTVEQFGRLDVVVNNAGYSLVGSMEEITDQEFRASLDVNLFAMMHVIRHAMPYLRQQGSGHIINMASNAGYIGYQYAGSYNIAKYATIGMSEALALEAEPFGIKVTMVAPGEFRTNFMGKGSLQFVQNRIDVYGMDQIEKEWTAHSGQQLGDPEKLVKILADIADMDTPPLRLLLGPDSYELVLIQREKEMQEFEKWKDLTLSTNMD